MIRDGPRNGSEMGLVRLIAAPIKSIVRFPLFQLAVVVGTILFLQAAADDSFFGKTFAVLDNLVEANIKLFSELFRIKAFTRSGLTASLMIVYVYVACLLFLVVARIMLRGVIDFLGWSNAFGLRNAIARERGVAAYRAWLPLERIRPAHIPQQQWEETFAWPADNKPPYPTLFYRMLRGSVSYLIVIVSSRCASPSLYAISRRFHGQAGFWVYLLAGLIELGLYTVLRHLTHQSWVPDCYG